MAAPGIRKVLHLSTLALLLRTTLALDTHGRWPSDGLKASVDVNLGCRNGLGRAVDWWLILKAPNGTRYGYIDADTAASTVAALSCRQDRLSSPRVRTASAQHRSCSGAAALDDGWRAARHLNGQHSPLSRTLLPLYSDAKLSRRVRFAKRSLHFSRASAARTHHETACRLAVLVKQLAHWSNIVAHVVFRIAHVMYNDETPQGPVSIYRGHAKGVLAFAGDADRVRRHILALPYHTARLHHSTPLQR